VVGVESDVEGTEESWTASEEFRQMSFRFFASVTAALIAQGAIDPAGKSSDEIFDESKSIVAGWFDEDPNFELDLTVDHTDGLLEQSARAMNEDKLETSVLLLATWFEHWINYFLGSMLYRRELSDEAISVLVRELKIRTKFTAFWELLRLDALDDEHLAAIQTCVDRRNEFAHYKWRPSRVGEQDVLRRTITRGLRAVERLQQIEDEHLYGGRRAEFVGQPTAVVGE